MHCWYEGILAQIGKSLGAFINYDDNNEEFTSFHLQECVHIDLSKGLLNKMMLEWEIS
jgi:hypothetical protein